jgi:hypothetical protein
MIKKSLLTFLILVTVSTGKELKLANIQTENVPDTYKEVLRDFLEKNFYIKEEAQGKDKVKLEISWTGLSYTVCLNFLYINKEEKISCFTAQTGEDLYEKFFQILEEYKKHEPAVKNINLPVKTNTSFNRKKLRISSEKRDILVGYKPVFKTEGKALLEGSINIDTLYLNDEEAGKLLKLLLSGKRIKQILIIK